MIGAKLGKETCVLEFLAAALALLPAPALADITARYVVGTEKHALLVEVDDGGNARIGVDGKFGVIHRDGIDYMFMVAPTGETRVTELAELAATVTARMQGAAKPSIRGAASTRSVLTPNGTAIVAGRAGTAWSVGPGPAPRTDPTKPPRSVDVVVSSDPPLAPIGNVFRRMRATLAPLFGLMFPESKAFGESMTALLANGTPLRIEPLVELQSADTAEIDPKRFELPAPVLSATEFLRLTGLADMKP